MFAIIGEIRKAKGAGYRAGRAGSEFSVNPYRNQRRPLLSSFWGDGWEKGMKERLSTPQWIVEMNLGGKYWDNIWFDEDENPEIFSSSQAAQAAIDDHLHQWEMMRGYDDAPTQADFRVRELGREFYAA